MEIIKFKTNVESQEALSKVAPYLDKEESISKWSIDTESTDKILSVSGTNLDAQTIKQIIKQAGFRAEIKRVIGLSGGDL
ncbi:copper chaperone [Pontibacter beigongshangensis]|uniref:copper chaperone n=1 Tax=Pontibacter beigongshangensis TaxID=2574733 RepID=UPI00164FCBE3|nr:copper chaperone [Pontibacter beigongshangensis]